MTTNALRRPSADGGVTGPAISELVFRYSSDQPPGRMSALEPNRDRFRFRFQTAVACRPSCGMALPSGRRGGPPGRERHMGTGRDRIEVARQQERQLTRLADTPGDLARLLAGAAIENCACRAPKGR